MQKLNTAKKKPMTFLSFTSGCLLEKHTRASTKSPSKRKPRESSKQSKQTFPFPSKSGNRSLWQGSGTDQCFSWLLLKKRMTFRRISFRSPIAFCNNTTQPSATTELTGQRRERCHVVALNELNQCRCSQPDRYNQILFLLLLVSLNVTIHVLNCLLKKPEDSTSLLTHMLVLPSPHPSHCFLFLTSA